MPLSFQPMPLSRRPRPFNHPEWLFELKYDGFRALARIKRGECELISRNGHPFSSFVELGKSIALALPQFQDAVLDGETETFREYEESLTRNIWNKYEQKPNRFPLSFCLAGPDLLSAQ